MSHIEDSLNRRIRGLVISDQRILAERVSRLLETHLEMKLIVSSASDLATIEIIAPEKIDVVLIDLMDDRSLAIQITRSIKEVLPEAKIIIMGLDAIDNSILRFVEAGATGYLLKGASSEMILSTIKAAYNGQTLCSPKVAASVFVRVTQLARLHRQLGLGRSAVLTKREKDILYLASMGLGNKEIAGELSLSLLTVKNHMHKILKKLQVRNRREAVRYFNDTELIES